MTSTRIATKTLIPILIFAVLALQRGQAQTYTVVHGFTGTEGLNPNGALIQDAAGNLYGTTYRGGAYDAGTVFKLDTAGLLTVLYSFTGGNDGGGPLAGLFRDPAGNLFGTTADDAAYPNACGTVFRLDTNNALTVLHIFRCLTEAANPTTKLVSVNGELYGTTVSGGSGPCSFGCGTIYKLSKTGSETVLYSFRGGLDGEEPQGLVRDSAGNLYGATFQSCTVNVASPTACGFGNVFELDTHGVFTVLHSFNYPTEGGFPVGRVIRDLNGIVHGTTGFGGDPTCNCGVVYRLDTNGNETIVHKFFGRQGGSEPDGGLLDVAGTLYGTTAYGGDLTCMASGSECGVLFKIGNTGQYAVLHRFTGGTDGLFPRGELTRGVDGSIYGVTWAGGPIGGGTIFKYTP